MRIRTLAPLAVLFVGLTVLGCEAGDDDVDDMDDLTEEPAEMGEEMGDEMDEGVDDVIDDTVRTDSAMMEDGAEMPEE